MPFQIVHNDISKMNTEAIVNATNSYLQQGGGVSDAIFEAAGAELLRKECEAIGLCAVGNSVITKGYRLPAKYIIHTVGPHWNGGSNGEDKLLALSYRSSLELAKRYNIASISLPLISSGNYGYPKDKALQIAILEINDFLLHNDMDICLVVYDRKSILLSEKLFSEINHYIDTYYENRNRNKPWHGMYWESIENDERGGVISVSSDTESADNISRSFPAVSSIDDKYFKCEAMPRRIDEIIDQIDETFSEMLFRLIDEKGRTEVEIYKKANIDRKLFSKIRNNKDYQPKKNTALALAIALELSLDETKELLMKAGYTLSNCNRFDLIIRYFIENRGYDIYIINEALFSYNQPLLGA